MSKVQVFTEGTKGNRCSVITEQRLFCINGIKTKYQSIYWSIIFCPSHLQPRKGLYLTAVLRYAACNTGDVCMLPSKGLGRDTSQENTITALLPFTWRYQWPTAEFSGVLRSSGSWNSICCSKLRISFLEKAVRFKTNRSLLVAIKGPNLFQIQNPQVMIKLNWYYNIINTFIQPCDRFQVVCLARICSRTVQRPEWLLAKKKMGGREKRRMTWV